MDKSLVASRSRTHYLVHIVFIPILDVSFDEMMGYPYEHEDEMINEIGNSIMKLIY